jgi:hypothetical protein
MMPDAVCVENAVSFERLYADHLAIERVAKALLMLVGATRPDPVQALRRLEQLTGLVRDHVAEEDPVIYATVEASERARHGHTAATLAEEFERLKEDWSDYCYRWDAAHVVADWAGFARETRAMLGRLQERVTWETSVLYALAVHHGVLRAD